MRLPVRECVNTGQDYWTTGQLNYWATGLTIITSTNSFACFSYFPSFANMSSPAPAVLFMVQRSEEFSPPFTLAQGCTQTVLPSLQTQVCFWGVAFFTTSVWVCRTVHSPILWSTNSHCAVVSLASASLAWPDPTIPGFHPLQLLFHNHVHFSYCSPLASASVAAPQLHPPRQLLIPDCVKCEDPTSLA